MPGYAYAAGGIAMTPQIASLAERGPEIVLPLNKMGAFGNTVIVNLKVMGDVVSEGELKEKVQRFVNDGISNNTITIPAQA